MIVLCCKCGIRMQLNAANMCVNCLSSEHNITEGLRKHFELKHCPECDRYLQPPRNWIKIQLESKELLAFCLKKLQKDLNSNKVRMVHAEFIWTEPHSKRIKVKLKVQKEIINGVILEQSYVVEYVQREQMCESCSRVQGNPDQWVAAVQLRQHVSHRRTFFYLEQVILKHDAAGRAKKIKEVDNGIDFFFSSWSHGAKFVEFLGKVSPVRLGSRGDKQLVSHDPKSNNYNYKYTFSVEIAPICREDLICLPQKVAAGMGNFGPLVICTKVTNNIVLLDPFSLRHCFLDADQYWRASFKSLLTSRQLVKYIVLDLDVINSAEATIDGRKYVLAEAQVARISDFGKNDTIFSIKTHLGNLLRPGDYALGYDLYAANTNDIEFDKYKSKGLVLPEAILVNKSYEEKSGKKRLKPQLWKLKSLPMEVDDKGETENDKKNKDYEEFLRGYKENPELWFNLSVTEGEEAPSVPLDEVMAALDLSEEEDGDFLMEE
ncbi:uncharacterized protein LOC107486302 [Arachis duranensis]|uniref:60S ribosomal export protein NMD3 n=1 Tax=Arachis duranensis TaxID=130453 RepID=A0A9C6TN37_ARADU|nr:uncharacterized protein LOC107486302 [Arachis duranensis]